MELVDQGSIRSILDYNADLDENGEGKITHYIMSFILFQVLLFL